MTHIMMHHQEIDGITGGQDMSNLWPRIEEAVQASFDDNMHLSQSCNVQDSQGCQLLTRPFEGP